MLTPILICPSTCPSASPSVTIGLFSTFVHLLLFCKQLHLYHFLIPHANDITYLSSLSMMISRFIHVTANDVFLNKQILIIQPTGLRHYPGTSIASASVTDAFIKECVLIIHRHLSCVNEAKVTGSGCRAGPCTDGS